MDFGDGFFGDEPDKVRSCYLRAPVLRKALEDPKILDALIKVLQVPGKPNVLKALSSVEKFKAIEQQIESYRRSGTSIWYNVPAREVLAASIYRSGLSDKHVLGLFCDVKKEADLLAPVARWLKSKGLSPYAEVPMGMRRVDVLGHSKSWIGGVTLVAVELKNDREQLKRALDQMTTFGEYAHRVYLACTPALAAGYLEAHAEARGVRHYDPAVFDTKLRTFGFGVLLVEGPNVYEWIQPRGTSPKDVKLNEVLACLPKLTPVVTG